MGGGGCASLEGVKGREGASGVGKGRAWCVDKRADLFRGTCVGSLCLLACRDSVGCICVCVRTRARTCTRAGSCGLNLTQRLSSRIPKT